MAKLNANKTQIQTVIKFDANSDTATIGGTFSKDMPETAGVNYCTANLNTREGEGDTLIVGNVSAIGPKAAACQAGMNALVAEFKEGRCDGECHVAHDKLTIGGVCEENGTADHPGGGRNDGDMCSD